MRQVRATVYAYALTVLVACFPWVVKGCAKYAHQLTKGAFR